MPFADWEKVSRSSDDYKICLVGTTAVGAVGGMAVGAFTVNPLGVLGGGVGGALLGLGFGYIACPYLAPLVKRKIMNGERMDETEVRTAAEAMSRYAGISNAEDSVRLLARVRQSLPSAKNIANRPVCQSPQATAQMLLHA